MKIKPLYCGLAFIVTIIFIAILVIYKKQANEKQNWQFLIRDQVGALSILNVGKNFSFDERKIYFSDGKGLIHALNKNSGQIEWLSQLRDHSPFQINQDQKSLYISCFDSHIYSLDKKNGYINWSFAIPNQFWPDTEVVSDDEDRYVFFADRGGFLYALDKQTGQEIWHKKFDSIDVTKAFVENTVHFGFIYQENNLLKIDHFPSQIIYTIKKESGEIIEQKKSNKDIQFKKEESSFSFGKNNLNIEQNIISQPTLNLFDKKNNLLWKYQTENRINPKEIYKNDNRIYYLNADNTILESILIQNKDPNNQFPKRVNFTLDENFTAHYPYKKSNPQANQKIKQYDLLFKLNSFIDEINYRIKNFKKLFIFTLSQQENSHFLEFTISHQQNFYKNVFTQVKIRATFTNQETKQQVFINGFYYDYNLWKVRAKLGKGHWNWQIKVQTPFWTNKQSGELQITKDFPEDLTIKDGTFVIADSQIFFPIGLQDVILDLNRDGNPLNQIGFAKDKIPATDIKKYNYLPFDQYLDLYKNEAGINLFRYGPDNFAPAIWENLTNAKNFKMDVNGNLQGDYILEEAKKRDLKIMMSIFAFYPPYISKEAISNKSNQIVLKQYLDYIIARYATNVDIWELTNEALPSQEWQNFVSDYLSKKDPYHHPITTNLENTKLKNSDLLSIHLYAKPKNNAELVKKINETKEKQNWTKAIIMSELGFSGANYFSGSADLMRKMAWIFTFKKIGMVWWNVGDRLWENGDTSNIYIGPQERLYLNELQKFLPKMQAPLASNFKMTNEERLAAYTLKDQNHELFYLLNLSEKNKNEYQLPINISANGNLEIFNPRNNTLIKKIIINETTKKINLPYFKDDLAIKITY